MKGKKRETFWQPRIYFDDGTNIDWIMPEGLNENNGFCTREEAVEYMDRLGYCEDEINVTEVKPADWKDITLLDYEGNSIE